MAEFIVYAFFAALIIRCVFKTKGILETIIDTIIVFFGIIIGLSLLSIIIRVGPLIGLLLLIIIGLLFG